MISALSSFFTNLVYKNDVPMEMADIDKIFEKAETENVSKYTQRDEISWRNEESCFYTTGIISAVLNEYVLIDNKYICDNDRITMNVEVGNKVRYLASQADENKEIKIHKIMEVCDSSWDEKTLEETQEENKPDPLIQRQMIRRTLLGKVMRREGRSVFIEPHSINFNLDKVRSEFIPLVGDWVNVDALVEVSEEAVDFNGEILEVESISPLRSKLDTGVVTFYDENLGVGNVNRTIIFTKVVCEAGYVPCVGDKVVSDSIESDQGKFAWRSLTIVPLSYQKPQDNLKLSNTQKPDVNELGKEEELGLIVTSNLEFSLVLHEEREISVKIENISNREHVLVKCCFLSKKMESQLRLLDPNIDDRIFLKPGDEISYKFLCKAKFMGTSTEKFLFIFQNIKVIRTFRFVVQPKRLTGQQHFINNEKKHIVAKQEVFDEIGYIPGVRPCKPPNFVAVRSGIFKIPNKCWTVVLEAVNNRYSQIEQEILIGEILPCLTETLSMLKYKEKFHHLLYLEEIAQNILMQKYDMESAILTHCGEYLSLNVPGLAEKRPSLIVGDKVIVNHKWDSSTDKRKYEGFVHKVRSSEVLLKFNPKFHQDYNNEDCEISFKGSITTIRRCHDAVNLAITRLGVDFLFPNKIVEKPPQYQITEIEEMDLAKTCPLRKEKGEEDKRNVSVSSNDSNKSLNLNLCNEEKIKSPPKVSVVERLFHTKPSTSNENTDNSVFIVTKVQSCEKHQVANNVKNIKKIEKRDFSNKAKNTENSLESIESELKKRKLIWYNKRLNYYQKRAVLNILKGLARPLPYVIFGPPGTGKTITLCEAALQILTTISDSRLMMATPSNSSANLIAERLLDSGVLKPGDMVRLVAQHCIEEGTIPERLVPYCATGTLQEERSGNTMKIENSGFKSNCTASVLGRHRITIGTCSALGIIYNMGFAHGHFTHVLVDEAGQATEPEIMIPLTFIRADNGQVIIAGDPMQLGPVVQSKFAQHFGLGESFLSRLLQRFPYQRDPQGFETGYDPRLITKLLINYRSLPEILELPNSLFYDSELIPQISSDRSNEATLLNKLAPELPERSGLPPAIVFHGVNGNNYQPPDSPSWYNPEEATQVYFYLLKLYNRGLRADDIGIITPYVAQVRQIRDLLLELEMEAPKVGSVEEFQGQERNVIILSTVRSTSDYITDDLKHTLGFVSSPRRLNVAITRARALLIIIGNPYVLCEDPYWRTVLTYCIERDAYTGCSVSTLSI